MTDAATALWYAQLPTLFAAAAALFTDPAGLVLLVKPNYRDHWSLPGGVLEHDEPPHVGCAREIAEELGISLTPGPLLVIDWVPAIDSRPRPSVHFVFDGGVIEDGATIRLQEEELDDYKFVPPDALDGYLPPIMSARVAAAVRARAIGMPTYAPWPVGST